MYIQTIHLRTEIGFKQMCFQSRFKDVYTCMVLILQS